MKTATHIFIGFSLAVLGVISVVMSFSDIHGMEKMMWGMVTGMCFAAYAVGVCAYFEGRDRGTKIGYDKGWKNGHKYGRSEGRKEGFGYAKEVLEDLPINPYKHDDDPRYNP